MVRLIALAFAVVAGLFGQAVEKYDLRKSPGVPDGNLIVVVKDRELRVSNKAIRVWPGWVATKLLYTQPAMSADGTSMEGEELRIYDAPSTTSETFTMEKASIRDVTYVLLGSGDIGFVISTLTSDGVPSVVLANNRIGVYRRVRLSAPGPITNDSVELRHFNPEDLKRANGEISRIPPATMSRVRLLPGDPSPIGNWVASLPAADAPARKVTLTLYPGGAAKLVTEFAGKGPMVRGGAWSQIESDLTVEFGPAADPLKWDLKPNELVPKVWNKDEYGSVGLPLKRSSAPWTQK